MSKSGDEHWSGAFSPSPRPGAQVVAEVDGERIFDDDVVRQARLRGLHPADALRELVDEVLLAKEAWRRGLADAREVSQTRARELVRRLIQVDFEASFRGPEDVPDEDVERVWQRPDIRAYFDHDTYRDVVFVRIPVAKGAPADADRLQRAAAQAICDRARAGAPTSDESFLAIARAAAGDAGAKLEAQRYSTTRHGRAVEEFAAAAFSIDRIGQIAGPVRTKWGWDVLYLVSIVPSRHASRDDAAPEIRRQIFETARRAAFLRWADALVAKAHVVTRPLRSSLAQAPAASPAP